MAPKARRDGVYRRADRNNEWWISYTDRRGKRRRRKTDAKNITQAKRILAAELLKVEQSIALGVAAPTNDTFLAASTQYLTYQRARVSAASYAQEEAVIRLHLRPFFKGRLADIRRVDVQHYMTTRLGVVSSATVVKEVNSLKHLMKLAVEWEMIPFSPLTGIKSPKVGPEKMRYLQPTEVRALIETAQPWLKPVIAVAAFTGMRRGEILGLRLMDVDLEGGRVYLPQTKNGEARIVPLNALAKDALQSVICTDTAKSGDLLFPFRPDWVTGAFRRLCKKVGLLETRFHDLRHTAASWMAMEGASIHAIALVLGHKDLRMAMRYQQLSPEFLSKTVGKLEGVFSLDQKPDQEAKNDADRHHSVTKLLDTGQEVTVSD